MQRRAKPAPDQLVKKQHLGPLMGLGSQCFCSLPQDVREQRGRIREMGVRKEGRKERSHTVQNKRPADGEASSILSTATAPSTENTVKHLSCRGLTQRSSTQTFFVFFAPPFSFSTLIYVTLFYLFTCHVFNAPAGASF